MENKNLIKEKILKDDEEAKIIIRMTKAQKEKYKRFFGAYGKNLSEGVRMALDFLYINVENNNLKISECGIYKNSFYEIE